MTGLAALLDESRCRPEFPACFRRRNSPGSPACHESPPRYQTRQGSVAKVERLTERHAAQIVGSGSGSIATFFTPARKKVAGRKSPITSRNSFGDCSCGTWAQPGMISRCACGKRPAKFMRHRRRCRLVMLADQHQHRRLHLSKLGPQVEARPARRRRRKTHRGRCAGTPRGDRPSGRDARAWKSGANSRRIATSVIVVPIPWPSTPPPCCERPARPGSENAAPQSASTTLQAMPGMADRHLQRDEAAIAVAKHDRVLSIGGVLHRFRHAIGDLSQSAGDFAGERPKPGNSGTIHPKRFRQFSATMASKLGAVRQQRVQQEQRAAHRRTAPR